MIRSTYHESLQEKSQIELGSCFRRIANRRDKCEIVIPIPLNAKLTQRHRHFKTVIAIVIDFKLAGLLPYELKRLPIAYQTFVGSLWNQNP